MDARNAGGEFRTYSRGSQDGRAVNRDRRGVIDTGDACGYRGQVRDRLAFACILAVAVAIVVLLQPAEGPTEEWLAQEAGWVCLGDDCRRPSEARAMRGRPRTTEPAEAYLFTYQREDGSVDHLAFRARGACEEASEAFGGSACRLHP